MERGLRSMGLEIHLLTRNENVCGIQTRNVKYDRNIWLKSRTRLILNFYLITFWQSKHKDRSYYASFFLKYYAWITIVYPKEFCSCFPCIKNGHKFYAYTNLTVISRQIRYKYRQWNETFSIMGVCWQTRLKVSPLADIKDKYKYGSGGPGLGAKVCDMRPATRVVINTAPQACAFSPLAHMLPRLLPAFRRKLPPRQHSVGHSDWIKLRHGCCGSDSRLVLSSAFCAAAIKQAIVELVGHLIVSILIVLVLYQPKGVTSAS